jgi:hypothetical protein
MGLLEQDPPLVVLYDLDILAHRLRELRMAFPVGTLHTVAMKANPLSGDPALSTRSGLRNGVRLTGRGRACLEGRVSSAMGRLRLPGEDRCGADARPGERHFHEPRQLSRAGSVRGHSRTLVLLQHGRLARQSGRGSRGHCLHRNGGPYLQVRHHTRRAPGSCDQRVFGNMRGCARCTSTLAPRAARWSYSRKPSRRSQLWRGISKVQRDAGWSASISVADCPSVTRTMWSPLRSET